jgi:uncharacterized membrane protein
VGWNRWYSTVSYVRSAIWVTPLIALVVEQIALRVAFAVDARLIWVPHLAMTLPGTLAAMDTIITLTVSFVVFTFGSLLVAIQVASGQLTPRIIATTLLRDNVIRFTVGLSIFTLLFAAGTKARTGETIPYFVTTVAVILAFASIVTFLYMIDYAARLLRPVSIVWRVGEQGIKVIESVYPRPIADPHVATPPRPKMGPPERTVVHRGTSGIVLAANIPVLVKLAQASNGILEFVPKIGDFLAVGEPLFHLHGGAAGIDDDVLRAQVAFGPERTIEQDSTFAFRVIVDIAIKALSKAINDPTTAVLAIDQLHRLLRMVGKRHLHDDTILDAGGSIRVVFPTPNWEDFIELAFSEIRLYGAENFQIARRLRAMIENLVATLSESRRPALQQELRLLDGMLEKLYSSPEDVARARVADLQGLGSGTPARSQ